MVLLPVIGIVVLLLVLLWRPNKYNIGDRWHQIKKGMPLTEVENVLGRRVSDQQWENMPTPLENPFELIKESCIQYPNVMLWIGHDVAVWVVFDTDNRVALVKPSPVYAKEEVDWVSYIVELQFLGKKTRSTIQVEDLLKPPTRKRQGVLSR
jgi:hypothetical protein